MIRDTHISVPVYLPESSIAVLRGILATDEYDARSPFSLLGLQSTKSVSMWLHTTPETESEIRRLVAEVKAFVRRRGRHADGSTVEDFYVFDQTTGKEL
jgi:hypothetical protein